MFSGKKKGRGRKQYATLGEDDDGLEDNHPTPNFSAFSIDEDDDDDATPPNPPLSTPSFTTGAPARDGLWAVYSALTFDWLRPLLDLGNSQEVKETSNPFARPSPRCGPRGISPASYSRGGT